MSTFTTVALVGYGVWLVLLFTMANKKGGPGVMSPFILAGSAILIGVVALVAEMAT